MESAYGITYTRNIKKNVRLCWFARYSNEGVQRYPLSNHLNWLDNGKPGGHKSPISILDSDALSEMYQNSLARIDATDTLVAIAKVP